MFNFNGVEPSGFEIVPAGTYKVAVTDAFFSPTRDGAGQYMKVEFTIIEGHFENRKVFSMYNLMNKNPQAVQIAMGQVVSMLIAMGYKKEELGELSKEDLLCKIDNKELQIKVGVRKSEEWGDQNNVKGYKPISSPLAASSEQPKGDIPF